MPRPMKYARAERTSPVISNARRMYGAVSGARHGEIRCAVNGSTSFAVSNHAVSLVDVSPLSPMTVTRQK